MFVREQRHKSGATYFQLVESVRDDAGRVRTVYIASLGRDTTGREALAQLCLQRANLTRLARRRPARTSEWERLLYRIARLEAWVARAADAPPKAVRGPVEPWDRRLEAYLKEHLPDLHRTFEGKMKAHRERELKARLKAAVRHGFPEPPELAAEGTPERNSIE